jgi:4-amino-4-deoxy-L-arabinose transferase-like glycosyltransferase
MPVSRRVVWLLFALILALAAFLRLYRLNLIDVRFDEASAAQLALTIVKGNLLRVAPFSGSVANHPPVYLYTLALPYLFTHNFLVVAAYRALLDVVAIALTGWLCKRYFNNRVALMAMLLFAAAPWAVQFARKTWLAPLPMFHALLLIGLLEVVQRRNAKGWFIAGAGLALSIGSHLSAIYFVPIVLLTAFFARDTLKSKYTLIGLAPVFLLAAIYLSYDAQHELTNLRAIFRMSNNGTFDDHAFRFAVWISGGAHISDLTGPSFPIWREQLPVWLNNVDLLQIVLLIACLLLMLFYIVRTKDRSSHAMFLLLVAFVLPILFQLRPSRPLQMHYFIILYPVVFVLMGLGFDIAFSQLRGLSSPYTFITVSLATSIIAILTWQIFTTVRFADFVSRYDTSNGGYGAPIHNALTITQLARDAVRRGEMSDVIIVTASGDPAVNEQATVMDVLLADTPHRFANANDGAILRGEPTQYIVTPNASAQLLFENLKPETAVRETIISRREGSEEKYFRFQIDTANLSDYHPEDALWQNGAKLIGSRIKIEKKSMIVEILLSVTQQPREDYHWFVRVFEEEKQIASRDIGGIHPSNWRVGDLVVHRFVLGLPDDSAKPTHIRIGSYEYPSVKQTPVLNKAGMPIDDGVTVVIAP